MNAAAADTGSAHDRQRRTLTSYIPPDPAIPTDYNCPPGACSTPIPPPPVQHSVEGFSGTGGRDWLIVMAAAVALFIAATRLIKGN
jgi:hypothetical protein